VRFLKYFIKIIYSAQLFYKEVEKSISKKSSSDIHLPQFFIFVLGKKFPLSDNLYYKEFKSRYQEDIPFLLEICVLENSHIKKAKNIEDMVLFILKFKNKKDLDRKDIEYDLIKLIPLANIIEQ